MTCMLTAPVPVRASAQFQGTGVEEVDGLQDVGPWRPPITIWQYSTVIEEGEGEESVIGKPVCMRRLV